MAERWRRVGSCGECGRKDEVIVFRPKAIETPFVGTWVCGNCDPGEHADYASGLATLGGEDPN